MLKNTILLIAGSLVICSAASAQNYEITENPVYDTTLGVTPGVNPDGTHDAYVDMRTYVKNLTSDTMSFTWKNITDSTLNPSGWKLTGICDNIICRLESDASWFEGEPQHTSPVDPNMTTIMEARIYAPTDAPDGTGIYKIKIDAAHQTDTVVFILTKGDGTGISVISLKDNRVSIYPNPASGSDLHVYIDRNLKAANATIYSIIGREQISLPVAKNKDLTTFNVSSLPAGLYILRLTDDQGQTITSRKFSKK